MNDNKKAYGDTGSEQAGFRRRDFIVPLVLALGLVALSRISFLWFHALAELFAVVVGISLYLIASRSFVFTRNGFLLFLAQGFFWAALVDLVHTLAYSGMGLVKDHDPNPATQLWLLARTLEAVTLLLGPRYLTSDAPPRWSFLLYGTLALGGIAASFAGLLPDAYIAGQGLTPFKIAAEYAIIALLAVASFLLYRQRTQLDVELYRLMLGVVSLTMLSEFAFTVYVGVYDLSNLVGHIFKFWAFWLLLLAITRRMLAQPFRMLSRQAHTFDHMPMPVLLTDTRGIVQSCNAAALRLHADGVGACLHEAWHPAGMARSQCPICRAIDAGEGIDTELHDPATNRWAAVQTHPITREGSVTGFVCVHMDVTEEHLAQARLIQAEKMEALGQLTSGLAHDFNNMMGAIMGAHELLAKQVGDNEKALRHLDLARRATERATGVTRSLLAVARKQSLEPRDIDIETAINDLLPLLAQSAGKQVAIEVRACPECSGLRARIDPSGLDNALLNLVINARDAMPQGGTVTLRAGGLSLLPDQPGHPAELKPGLYIVLDVVDSGCGMPPEVVLRAFDPFFTTKAPGKGTGLGLPMVYGFARQSGGTATLDSAPGHGTTVTLYLPAVALSDNSVSAAAGRG